MDAAHPVGAGASGGTNRRAIAAKPVVHDGKTIPVTASIGVSSYEPGCPATLFAHLVKAADLAPYNAKQSGRNQVKVFTFKVPAKPNAA